MDNRRKKRKLTMTTEELHAIIETKVTASPHLSTPKFVEQIMKEHKIGLSPVSLGNIIKKWRVDHDLQYDKAAAKIVLEFDHVQDEKYDVIGGNYVWNTARGEINLPVSFVDQLFYEYSEYGLNLSQTEIINKHNLKVWQWHSIKRMLELFKKSNIFSPHTVDSTPPLEIEQMIKEKMDALMGNVGYQVEQQYDKALRKKYKAVIKDETNKELERQSLLLELQDIIPAAVAQIAPKIKVTKTSSDDIVSVFVFDVHFGAENRTADLPEYSPERTKEMFSDIAKEINKLNAKKVHLFFGGDNIETFTGMNHPDSWKGIAKGYFGSQLVLRAYKAFVEFISEVNNVAAVYAVPGNHDRATSKKEEDGQGWIAEILFELIRLSYHKHIPILYDEKVISVEVDGINYIMQHGHTKAAKINPAEIILEVGDPSMFNLLATGHFHRRDIIKDHKSFRQIICPSLFCGNDFSIDLGFSSNPGFVIVKNNGKGKPQLIDYSL